MRSFLGQLVRWKGRTAAPKVELCFVAVVVVLSCFVVVRLFSLICSYYFLPVIDFIFRLLLEQ